MPYVSPERRERLVWMIGNGNYGVSVPETGGVPGELNYILTEIINKYLAEFPSGLGMKKWHPDEPASECYVNSYADYNEVIGVLECCKLELYRRVVAPYEDKKIKENGDVY